MSKLPPLGQIPIEPSGRYLIGERWFTGQQLADAIQVCWGLATAYAQAESENGGGNGMDWEWLDTPAEMADQVLANYMSEVIAEARGNNDFTSEEEEPENPMPLLHCTRCANQLTQDQIGLCDDCQGDPVPKSFAALYAGLEGTPAYEAVRAQVMAERKKSDDTEGGACD